MTIASVALRVITLLTVINVVTSIKCWACRSDIDPKCADPFDNSTLPIYDCEKAEPPVHLPLAKATMCRKTRQKVNGEWRYFRSCAFVGEPGIGNDERFCVMRSGTYNIFVEYCTCNTKDGCNSSPSVIHGGYWIKWLPMSLSTIGLFFSLK